MKLDDILSPIESELHEFQRRFKDAMTSEVGLLDKVAAYILRQKGKQMRPMLVLLSASVAGGINDGTYRGAALVELLHTATLIHDDVVDTADMRRGIPAINALWKNKVAVLMGDYLLSRGLLLALKNNDHLFLSIVSDAVRRMSEGELLQIEKTRRLDIDETTYFKIISDKTASLISTSCEIGAASATTDEAARRAMRECGEAIGIAFQIRDDILDYLGKPDELGKPVGGDIKEKKITLPLIYALSKASDGERDGIISILKSDKKRTLFSRDVIEFAKQRGGIDYAEDMAIRYAEKAQHALSQFPESKSKTAMQKLIGFAVERRS
ncbi:MAG: polyprenyl synthetase [[Candidatus Thermochlorobacteriaceae] bacterium GBChlB]|nr:MAG: polyprenyl synthetase [[Candidatus Thermochlorobacteriaceae] bacterium GBChlB]